MAEAPIVIIRRSGETAGLAPEAAAALGASYDRPFHHEAHRVRHPLGIYNVSLARVLDRFETALQRHESIVKTRPFERKDDCASGAPPWLREFLTAYEQLLYALAEHVEDCYTILETCLPPGELKKHPARKAYLDATDEYRDQIGRFVNYIKHQHGRLRLMAIADDEGCNLSYYVEGIGPDGCLGPAIEVHGNANTMCNVGVDLRFHFGHLYVLGLHLSRAVESILGEGIDSDQGSDRLNESLIRIAETVHSLPLSFNVSHMRDTATFVRLFRFGQDTALVVRHPASLVFDDRPEVSSRAKSHIYMESDGTTRQFAFPHLD